ncbi:hypothetical protein [Thermodesulfobacterium hydrogeniphilum]|nr:hypothetical protein [Thermodesulfobacterium hydrogeniphilum]
MRFKSGVGFLCFLISLFTFALNACASKKITIKEIELAQKNGEIVLLK